jgi:hypothetical protein
VAPDLEAAPRPPPAVGSDAGPAGIGEHHTQGGDGQVKVGARTGKKHARAAPYTYRAACDRGARRVRLAAAWTTTSLSLFAWTPAG